MPDPSNPHSHDYQSALNWAHHNSSHSSEKSPKKPEGVNWFWVIVILLILGIGIWWWVYYGGGGPAQVEEPTLDPNPENRIDQMKQQSQGNTSHLQLNS